MKKIIVFFCALHSLYMFSQKDTVLYTKKFNITGGCYLSIPQNRNLYGWAEHSGNIPNTSSSSPYAVHHVTKSIYQSSSLGNGLMFYVHANFKITKRFYFETGVDATLSFQKNIALSDSLYLINGLWGLEASSTLTVGNFSVPLGLQYRLKKRILVSAGFAANFYTFTRENITSYQEYAMYQSHQTSSKGEFFPVFYVSSDIRVFPRTFLSLKISNTSLPYYNSVATWLDFHSTLYYSAGIKFFVY
ncbi:MAG: hypothetical protein JST67_02415 [Bacteroidetes bacterium]|nr:hypothetical protein [Bacteroidota bacterium]